MKRESHAMTPKNWKALRKIAREAGCKRGSWRVMLRKVATGELRLNRPSILTPP